MSEDTEPRIIRSQAHVEWKMQKFCNQPKKKNYLVKSPPFHFTNSKWYFIVYPNGHISLESEGWIGVFLNKEAAAEECYVVFRIGIKKQDGSELRANNFEANFEMEEHGFGDPRVFERHLLESSNDIIASDGSLTFFCTVRTEDTTEAYSQTTSPYDISTLAEDLKRLYFDMQYADITIKIKNVELVAHKCILAARSKVFAAMFEHDIGEKNSGIVEVDDSNLESFEDFILYLYTGKLDMVSSRNALSLYQTADKYDVVELKEECARIMERQLPVESVTSCV